MANMRSLPSEYASGAGYTSDATPAQRALAEFVKLTSININLC